MFLYRDILKQSIKLTWTYKYLWFFGLFAAWLEATGGYKIFVQGLNGEKSASFFNKSETIAETGIFSSNIFTNIAALFQTDTLAMITLLLVILIILALVVFLIWLTIISQVALVNNSAKLFASKISKIPKINEGIMSGIANFWPVTGLNILSKLIIGLSVLMIGLPIFLFSAQTGGLANYLFIILFIIFIPIAIIFSFVIKYAIAYVVIKGLSFIESIKAGWHLFTNNWLVSIEMALILFLTNFLVSLGILMAIMILAIPLLFLLLLFYKLLSIIGFWIILILGFFILLFVFMAGVASLTTFQISAWTKLFLELTSRGGASKLMRVIGGLTKK